MTVGDKIRQIRKQRGMSQQELADALGIRIMTVSNYETNKYVPSGDRLQKIADALCVDVKELQVAQADEIEDVVEIKHKMPATMQTPTHYGDSDDRQKMLIQMSSDMTAAEIKRVIAYLQGLLILKSGDETE